MVTAGRRAAVLGSPVRHSLSPVLHRAAYEALGLTGWTYEAYDVDAPALAGFLDGLDDRWAGLSLTMPLKTAVLPLLDRSSDLVRAVGGANTVLLGDGLRSGENTDVPGLVAALAEQGTTSVRSACVLGGGATAASALAALAELGARTPVVVVRDPGRTGALAAAAERLGVRPQIEPWAAAADAMARADLVVATTPAGSTDALAGTLPDQVGGLLFDVVYDPWPTRLAAAWAQRGGAVLGGLDLLVHQAVLQVALMTSAEVDAPALAAVLRAAGESALRTG
jgi:shikimate dehydrogenase